MKITKKQLRRIIKEEKQKLLVESAVRRIVRRRLLEQAANNQNGGNVVATRRFYDMRTEQLIKQDVPVSPGLNVESQEYDVDFGNGLIVSQEGEGPNGVRKFTFRVDGDDSKGLAPMDHLTPEQLKMVGLAKFQKLRMVGFQDRSDAMSPFEAQLSYVDYDRSNGEATPKMIQASWSKGVSKQRRQLESMLKMIRTREQKFAGKLAPEILEALAGYAETLEQFLADGSLGLPATWTPIEPS